MPLHVTMLKKTISFKRTYIYNSKYGNTFIFNKSSITKFAIANTYICVYAYNYMGDELFALQMNSLWDFLKYQVFHFSFPSLPPPQIS